MIVDYNGTNLPYKYKLFDKLNTATVPSTIHLTDNKMFEFHAKYLLQKAMSVLKLKVPDWWGKDYTLYTLFCNGYVGIINTPEFGIIPQFCTLQGYNVFYEPKAINVENPLLPHINNPLDIGKDCEIIKLMPDYSSILDIVGRYAAMMALCDECTDINIFNSKLSYVFAGKDKAAANSFKAMFDQISAGEPAVAVGKSLFDDQGKALWNSFSQNLSANFIAPDIQSLKKKIEDEFDSIVGIPNANTDKKERLVVDEVNANNVDTYCRAALWLETIKEGIDRTIKLFPELEGQLSVDWRIDPESGVNNGSDFTETEEGGNE